MLVSYEASSWLWGFLKILFGLDPFVIRASQFSSSSNWEQFLDVLRLNQQETHHLAIDGAYPPTYLEAPCAKCGLIVPAFEATCPNCATPRTSEKRPVSQGLQKFREAVADPQDAGIRIGTGETHTFDLRPGWWSNGFSIVTIVPVFATQIPFLMHQHDHFYRQPVTSIAEPTLLTIFLYCPW